MNPPKRSEHEITPEELQTLLQQKHPLTLIDCRQPEEYALARLDGARLIPLGELANRAGELAEELDAPVVVYCHHGVRSLQAAAILRHHGVSEVKSLAGGIDLWSQTIDPSVPRYE